VERHHAGTALLLLFFANRMYGLGIYRFSKKDLKNISRAAAYREPADADFLFA